MRVGNMCYPVMTLMVVTLVACAAALPASSSGEKVKSNTARSIKRSPMYHAHAQRQTAAPPPPPAPAPAPVTKKPVKYCHFQTPCAWRIYSDYSEISITNNFCVCRASQRCKLYERHIFEGYSEFRCMRV